MLNILLQTTQPYDLPTPDWVKWVLGVIAGLALICTALGLVLVPAALRLYTQIITGIAAAHSKAEVAEKASDYNKQAIGTISQNLSRTEQTISNLTLNQPKDPTGPGIPGPSGVVRT